MSLKNANGQTLSEAQLLDIINSKKIAEKTSEARSFKYIIPEGEDEKKFRKELRENTKKVLFAFKQFAGAQKGMPTKEAFNKSEVFKQFSELQKSFVKGVKFSEFYTPQKGGRDYQYYSALNEILRRCE